VDGNVSSLKIADHRDHRQSTVFFSF